MTKRALLIGIDDYANIGQLNGCTNDANVLRPLLERDENGTPNFECMVRTSDKNPCERDDLLADVETLLGGGADVALLYFAGHGQTGAAATDVSIVTRSATPGTPGIPLSEVLAKAVDSPVGEIILILDCCFSGAAGGVPQLGTAAASLRQGVSILAASRGDQPAAETPDHRGAFSTHLCAGLEGGAADVLGKVTLAGLYAYLDESFGAFEQRPVFKANVERLNELRKCAPAVPLDELRLITSLFPDRDYIFPLDPSYEPKAEPPCEGHEATFAILQKYRAAKLLEPVGAAHMYFAAIESKACRLTFLGEHYRQMAAGNRI